MLAGQVVLLDCLPQSQSGGLQLLHDALRDDGGIRQGHAPLGRQVFFVPQQLHFRNFEFLPQLPDFVVQRLDPGSMFADGLDAAALVPQHAVDRLGGQLPPEFQPPLLERLHPLLLLQDLQVQLVEALDAPFRQGVGVPALFQLPVQVAACQPFVADLDRDLDGPRVALQLDDALLELSDFGNQGRAFGGQVGPAPRLGLQIGDFGGEFALLLEQPADGRGLVLRAQQLMLVRLQFAHDLHERHAVHAARQIVEQFRGIGVVQRGQFLQLADPHGKHIVEDRLVDARQQHVQQVLPLATAVGGQDDGASQRVVAAFGQAPLDHKLAIVVLDPDQAAGDSSVDRRQVQFAPLGRETVEHGTEELHQGCLPCLVAAEEQGHAVGQFVDGHFVPDTEAVNTNVGDLHVVTPSNSACDAVRTPCRD